MKRHFIESSYSHYGACVFRRFWTKHQGWAEKTMPLSLNCVFVNRCGLASTLTVKRFSMCFHKNPFLVSWACQKSFFSNMHNVVLHASFRLSKRAVVTKQSKTPSYETPNWLFCPLFWLHSILVAWTFLMFVPHFLMPVVAKPKTMKQRQFLHNCWWLCQLFFSKVFKKNN